MNKKNKMLTTPDMVARFETLEFLANKGYETLKSAVNAKDYNQSQAYAAMAHEFYHMLGNELKYTTEEDFNFNILVTDEDPFIRYTLQYNIAYYAPESIKYHGKQAHVINHPINAEDIKEVIDGNDITQKLTFVPETKPEIARYGDIRYFSIRLMNTGKFQDLLEVLDHVRSVHPKLIT